MRPRIGARKPHFVWTNTWVTGQANALTAGVVTRVAPIACSPNSLPLPAPWNGKCTVYAVRGHVWQTTNLTDVIACFAIGVDSIEAVNTNAVQNVLAAAGSTPPVMRGDFLWIGTGSSGAGGLSSSSAPQFDIPILGRTRRILKGGQECVFFKAEAVANATSTWTYAMVVNVLYRFA